MKDKVFVRLDGDNIGDKIELALLDGEWEFAQQVHDSVQMSMKSLKSIIIGIESSIILMAGCDDILFSLNKSYFNEEDLSKLKATFLKDVGLTMSVGVGKSPIDAINNLRRAKISGKNRIVY